MFKLFAITVMTYSVVTHYRKLEQDKTMGKPGGKEGKHITDRLGMIKIL